MTEDITLLLPRCPRMWRLWRMWLRGYIDVAVSYMYILGMLMSDYLSMLVDEDVKDKKLGIV